MTSVFEVGYVYATEWADRCSDGVMIIPMRAKFIRVKNRTGDDAQVEQVSETGRGGLVKNVQITLTEFGNEVICIEGDTYCAGFRIDNFDELAAVTAQAENDDVIAALKEYERKNGLYGGVFGEKKRLSADWVYSIYEIVKCCVMWLGFEGTRYGYGAPKELMRRVYNRAVWDVVREEGNSSRVSVSRRSN